MPACVEHRRLMYVKLFIRWNLKLNIAAVQMADLFPQINHPQLLFLYPFVDAIILGQ